MSNRPHLLLLHGALGCSAQFQQLQQYLSDVFTIHLFDFPGHGNQPAFDDFSIAGFADDLQHKCAAIGEPVAIFGYSMGGYVALYASLHFKLPVSQIITLGTKFDWRPDTAAKEASRLNPEKILEKVPAFAAQLARLHGEANWKMLVQNTAAMMLHMGNHPPLGHDDYQRINTRVHLLLGEADNMVSVDETNHVRSLLPSAGMTILPATSHAIDAVDHRMLAQTLVEILSV